MSNASAWVVYALSSITAPMKLRKSSIGPMRMVGTSVSSASRICGHRLDGAYTREAAEHFWPWYSNAPRRIAVATAWGSAELWARMKSLPPVSPTMRG